MKKMSLLISILFLGACAHHGHHDSKEKIEQSLTIGKDLKANRYDNLYFSAQPKPNDYQKLKAQGFKAIINLRGPSEYDEKAERKSVESAEMTYVNLPFLPTQELTDEYIALVTEAVVKQRRSGKVLVHCSSGNRVATWLGGHFHKDHGLEKSEAISTAQKLGLNHEGSLLKLKRYLSSK